jgi:hypothetical protein
MISTSTIQMFTDLSKTASMLSNQIFKAKS